MLIKNENSARSVLENPRGGIGNLIKHDYFNNPIKSISLNNFTLCELEVNSEIGAHEHLNNFEIYFFLSGIGIANDNGTHIEIKAGDTLITGPNEFHGLKNTGKTPIKFIAFICDVQK